MSKVRTIITWIMAQNFLMKKIHNFLSSFANKICLYNAYQQAFGNRTNNIIISKTLLFINLARYDKAKCFKLKYSLEVGIFGREVRQSVGMRRHVWAFRVSSNTSFFFKVLLKIRKMFQSMQFDSYFE